MNTRRMPMWTVLVALPVVMLVTHAVFGWLRPSPGVSLGVAVLATVAGLVIAANDYRLRRLRR